MLRWSLAFILLLAAGPVLGHLFLWAGCASGVFGPYCGHSSVFVSLVVATLVAWLLVGVGWAIFVARRKVGEQAT